MAKPRETTVRRVEWYCGPAREFKDYEDLATLDTSENVISPKVDGTWCMFGIYGAGGRHLLKSRDARTPPFSGDYVVGLDDLPFPKAMSEVILIGELEAATQWAKKQAEQRGYRRLHLYDIGMAPNGEGHIEDVRDEPLEDRLRRLIGFFDLFVRPNPEIAKRLVLVPHVRGRFIERYQQWIKEGYEGVVVKHRMSTSRPEKLDGKIHEWVRCKKWLTDEFVFCGTTMTPGGKYSQPKETGEWGLYKDGKLVKVMTAPSVPEHYKKANVGKLVCEFKGWERMDSGALRHAQFIRVRKDKEPAACVGGCFE